MNKEQDAVVQNTFSWMQTTIPQLSKDYFSVKREREKKKGGSEGWEGKMERLGGERQRQRINPVFKGGKLTPS